MANPLTGDFDAVLQVSGGTINRLLASLHQNGFTDSARPSFPHSIRIRLGPPYEIDGVVGTLEAQIGTPLVQLINGSTDTFWLEVGVRGWFKPDEGSGPLPDFIHGTVRAQYRIHDIDPNCYGWSQKASEYLWVRVVRSSVEFVGTTDEDTGMFIPVPDPGTALAQVRRQIAGLLATRFEATPHRVSNRFRRGSLRTIGVTNAMAVVAPVSTNGPPVGAIASVNTVFLGPADFGIATSRDAVLRLAEPALAPIRNFSLTVNIHIHTPWPAPDIHDQYRVTVNPPTVEWHAFGSFAVMKIRVSGEARADILPNATFWIEQDITLNFDPGAERLWLGVGYRRVEVDGHGPFGGLIQGRVAGAIDQAVKSIAEGAVQNAQPMLDAVIGRKHELIAQLKTLDPQAHARFDEAVFQPDGMILRGRIFVSGRSAPAVIFEKTIDKDGFTALKSWIPGGRIDRYEWTWGWFTGRNPGSSTIDGRFILRRPSGGSGPFGLSVQISQPLPGLDGGGKVCLRIRGVRVNPVTSQLEPVNVQHCREFGFLIAGPYVEGIDHQLYVPNVPELSQEVPFPQLAQVDFYSPVRPSSSANTLVLYAGETSLADLAPILSGGLQGVRRPDAGLALLVLVPEGQQARIRDSFAEIQRVCDALGLAALAAEDVAGRWAATFDLQGDGKRQAWRLMNPDGAVTWGHDGHLAGDLMTPALNQHLVTSGSPALDALTPIVDIGKVIGSEFIDPHPSHVISNCPPFPLNRVAIGTLITFVDQRSEASKAHLRRVAARYRHSGPDAPTLMVVVRGADEKEAEAFQQQLGLDIVALADPKLAITGRFGVRVWPTTFMLDQIGKVSAIETGGAVGRADDDARPSEQGKESGA